MTSRHLIASLTLAALLVFPASAATVFINEIHYDNTGTDVGEAIEIAGPAGTDLSGWSLVLYNGSGGASYSTVNLSGTIGNQQAGFGTLSFAIAGIQNGSPDGVALVDPGATVVQFLSYEGTFTAVGGPANGMLSVDIGVAESSGTPVGDSLQLTGTGSQSTDFAWASEMPDTFGAVNTGQTFIAPGPVDPVINEMVFNHIGSDTHEFVEVFGTPSTDYSAFTVLEIEGDFGLGTIDGVFTVGTTDAGGFWDTGFLANVIENGTVTLLLVEGFTGAVGSDVDADDDGLIDTAFWTRVVDSVAITDGGAGDGIYSPVVLSPGYDGNSFTPGGASRIPNGTDTDSVGDWVRNDFDGEGLPGFTGTPDPGEALNTPGAENALVPPGPAEVLINEVDADTPGTDALEFVEIYDGGAGNVALDGLVVVFYNGSSDTSYNAFDLDGFTTDANGYFVIGNAGVSPTPDIIIPSNGIQNGADAIAVYEADGTDFPNGTAVTTTNLVDAIVYDTNDADDAGLLVLLNAGEPQVNEDGAGDKDNDSSQRCPNGAGGARNTSAYLQAAPTPAADNDCPVANVLINEVDADTAGSDSLEFLEIFDGGTGSTALDGLVVVLYNGNGDVSYNAFDLDGFSTDANGYFVIGNAGVSPTPDIIIPGNGIQNGADAIAIYEGDGSDFPNGTAVTTANLVDAIVYDTNDSDDAGLLVLLNPGEPQVNEGGAGNKDFDSNQRCPNGFGGPRNTFAYVQSDPTPAAENDCPVAAVLINELDADTAGSDSLEFLEIYDGGSGSTVLNGLVVVLYNGSSDTVYNAFDLDGFVTDANGYFVIGNAGVTPTPDLVVPGNTFQNGADAVAVYAGNASDFPNGTAVTTTDLIDALVYDTNDSDDAGLLVLLNAGQPQVNEGGGGNKDFESNQRCPNGFGGERNTDRYAQASPTPAASNDCPPLEIFEIQGDGAASPFAGFTVNTASNVVTCVAPDGFFMQTPTARTDGDVDTSDGLFVFTGAAPAVAVGDLVDVSGGVSEFFGFTEINIGTTVTVVGTGTVPAPVVFDATVPSPDPTAPSCAIEFECYEGMLVEITGGRVTSPNLRFSVDPIAEVGIVAGPDRAFREKGIEFPGLFGLPVWDGNPEVFELDADKLGLPSLIIPAGSTFSARGGLGFEFGDYELWPNELTVVPAPLPVPVRPRDPGEFTVGTLNLFRLFDDVDDPPSMDAMGGNRDDSVVSTAEYLRRRAKFTSYILDVLDAPDILAVQEAEKLGVLQDLAADVAAADPSVVYTAYLVEGNDVGTIDVGFLVRDTVAVDAVTQLGASEILTFDGSLLHDRPPLLLEARLLCADGGDTPIQVMVVHNRSLSGIDQDPGSGPRVRQKRFEQAESIAQKVQAIQTADPDVNLVVLGDFNAFQFTDGYVDVVGEIKGDFEPSENLLSGADLVDPNLTNQVDGLAAEERYSFIFDGSAQALDHILTSEGLADLVRGAEFGRGNADAAVNLINDDSAANLPLRSSDHDGMVLYLTTDCDADGIPDDEDVCPGTVIPESVPTVSLGTNRHALVDGDGIFDTTPPSGEGPGFVFTIEDTAGCSCEQIIIAQGLGEGHVKHGCSISAMQDWIDLVNP